MRLCALSIDLDEIPHYHALHGVPPPQAATATAVYDVALPRFGDFARGLDVPLTLFAIGADMAREQSAAALRRLLDAGHELGNHSLDHRYDLTRTSRQEMVRQVSDAGAALTQATGHQPLGFRAPGYTVTDELFDVLQEAGVKYDSSVFPCPAYYGAKVVALGAIRLRRRRSQSILDTPAVLLAPTRPYRVGRPYWRRGHGLLELPIQVTRAARLPFIGTALTLARPTGARLLTQLVVGEPLVNLELHGIDALDADDGFRSLAPHQRDLSISSARKFEALSAVIETLRGAGYTFVRLAEAAEYFAGK